MMARGVAWVALCLVLLALAHRGQAARTGRSMVELDLAEESRMAQLRFEAGDPACGRFRFLYGCYDAPPSGPTPSNFMPQETTAYVEGAPILVEDYRPDFSDCGPLGKHKFRCVSPLKTAAPVEVAPVLVDPSRDSSAEVYGPDFSDCGPLGKHKFRCVPPLKTAAPVEVAPVLVDPSVEAYQPDQSDCGPLGKHKYRCAPPMQ